METAAGRGALPKARPMRRERTRDGGGSADLIEKANLRD